MLRPLINAVTARFAGAMPKQVFVQKILDALK